MRLSLSLSLSRLTTLITTRIHCSRTTARAPLQGLDTTEKDSSAGGAPSAEAAMPAEVAERLAALEAAVFDLQSKLSVQQATNFALSRKLDSFEGLAERVSKVEAALLDADEGRSPAVTAADPATSLPSLDVQRLKDFLEAVPDDDEADEVFDPFATLFGEE